MLSITSYYLKYSFPFILNAITTGFGFLLFATTSILSMLNAENDYHLMYLTDTEEWSHPFFQISRQQSLLSLITAFIFLMDFMFSMDLILVKSPDNSDIERDAASDDTSEDTSDVEELDKELHLYFFCAPIWESMKSSVRHAVTVIYGLD